MNNAKIYSNVVITTIKESRMPAFATFNRDVNTKHVDEIVEKMKSKGYRNAEVIQVLKAEESIEHGVTEMTDLNGNLIPEKDFNLYFLVPDGRHRTLAASRYNDWLIEQDQPTITIPAIEVELQNGETVAEYSGDINNTKKQWEGEDYINCAANLMPEEPLLQTYNEQIKTAANPNGIPRSTLNRIYCNGEGLSTPDLVLLCNGVKEKGVRVKRKVMPAFDIETGDKFISICRAKGFRAQEIATRYLITEFNKLRNSTGGVDFAFKVFDSITPDDITKMSNIHSHLIEQKVIDHFQVIIQRVRMSNPQPEPAA